MTKNRQNLSERLYIINVELRRTNMHKNEIQVSIILKLDQFILQSYKTPTRLLEQIIVVYT